LWLWLPELGRFGVGAEEAGPGVVWVGAASITNNSAAEDGVVEMVAVVAGITTEPL